MGPAGPWRMSAGVTGGTPATAIFMLIQEIPHKTAVRKEQHEIGRQIPAVP
ncbi:hypothetical protein [Sporomusa termitida]|uniref:hypothetical protein n=1 Tax=Sporomusa termitida TaxID=2377 RepID=UPI001478193A|nr:hypothetical protein [Sporomusa termitida]